MSGFVALCNRGGEPIDPMLLDDMTAGMAFRGPDAQGAWCDGPIGLGHTLLRTTFEADHEKQPCSVDGQVWVVADARIDGRRDLIATLRRQHRPVADDTPDVELILHAYTVWGEGCLDHLIGDFAFALWDGRLRRLFCARDHFGVAQLFYTQDRETLVVGNTLEPLLLHPDTPDTLDERAIADVALFSMYLDPDATAYAAIRRLPQGHKLVWGADGLRVERYWTLPEPDGYLRYRRSQDYVEHFRALFEEAVADRLRTDRAGAHLSGGMDSTSIAATVHHMLRAGSRPYHFKAYTMVYERLIPDDEGVYAEEVAKQSGFPVEFVVSERVMQVPPPTSPTRIPAEPGPTYAPGWYDISLSVSAFARVLFAGFGGDPALYPAPFSWRAARAALGQRQWLWPLRGIRRLLFARTRQQRQPSLPPWVNRQFASHLDLASRLVKRRQHAMPERRGMVEAALWRTIFAWSDPGFTGLPVKLRFPFFDRRLLEYLTAIPPAPWLEHKHLLRAAMGNRLPGAVLTRPKTPLRGQPLQAWLAETGVPAWEMGLASAPEMSPYLDRGWLKQVTSLPTSQQVALWAANRPPLDLAYWLCHRPRPESAKQSRRN